ncbi:30S ribosomal protein S8e [Candidatus Bathyarchaeota archaeon]|nr:MAG: 30S ribosomal protein S8e [Candidatus Bathyarchaeota archaeon]
MVWHGDLHKRKRTGGRTKPYRKKRKFERGRYPVETVLGEGEERKVVRVRGGGRKVKLMAAKYANISDPRTGKTVKVEILDVIRNPANMDYNRRRILTRGAIIRTELGTAKVVSRPGQNGVINAVLLPEE